MTTWLLVGGASALYLLSCVKQPYKRCSSCNGTGRNSTGEKWGPCWWCKQTGSRRRLGARLIGRGE